LVSTGGEEGTGAKTLGLLPRRAPAGNREPRAAFPVSGRGAGRGRAGVRALPLAGPRSGPPRGRARRGAGCRLSSAVLRAVPLLISGRLANVGFSGDLCPEKRGGGGQGSGGEPRIGACREVWKVRGGEREAGRSPGSRPSPVTEPRPRPGPETSLAPGTR
jgi:hypothetical protein